VDHVASLVLAIESAVKVCVDECPDMTHAEVFKALETVASNIRNDGLPGVEGGQWPPVNAELPEALPSA
jgi:hypothetical protein